MSRRAGDEPRIALRPAEAETAISAKDGAVAPATADMSISPIHAPDPAATDETTENARQGAAKIRDETKPVAVVGLGASAGGIAVLQQFFTDMAPDSGLAFVVVMHLSPDHESSLAQIIQQKTAMPVTQVNETVKVRCDELSEQRERYEKSDRNEKFATVEHRRQPTRRVRYPESKNPCKPHPHSPNETKHLRACQFRVSLFGFRPSLAWKARATSARVADKTDSARESKRRNSSSPGNRCCAETPAP